MLDFFTSLNEHNLPYPDPLHPIVVHFVIAMVLFSVFCDIAGYLTGKNTLFEVSWWNMCIATVAIFDAGQGESRHPPSRTFGITHDHGPAGTQTAQRRLVGAPSRVGR